MVKAAAVQMDIALAQTEHNKQRILEYAAGTDADLVAFPECSNSGYVFESPEEALPHAETVPGPFVDELTRVARDKRRCLAVGILENEGGELRNTALFITAQGQVHVYRKSHLPFLGVDRFVVPGGELPLFSTDWGKVGLLICYEWRFPEMARCLALAGADVIVGLSNWPQKAMVYPSHLVPARAAENHLWIVSSNRVGEERGTTFVGRSAVIGPDGQAAASLDGAKEGAAIAEMDLSIARNKHLVYRPGEYELDLFQDRHPDLYAEIVRGSEPS